MLLMVTGTSTSGSSDGDDRAVVTGLLVGSLVRTESQGGPLCASVRLPLIELCTMPAA